MTDPSSLFSTSRLGALTTLKRDGRPQLSNVVFAYDPADRVALISVTEDRAKTRNLRRDPRASLYVSTPDFSAYAVGEGVAELGQVATDPGDETVDGLVEYYRALSGEHPDWTEYREAMVADRRVLLRLQLTKIYGFAPDAE
jgi:PPOX class probable F420-dependent enzyme